MPRLQPSLIHQAGRISPHLAALLPVCRTIESAQNELRWIREHVHHEAPASQKQHPASRIARLVTRRATGVPLQYVLGSQPFADLRILCRRGVLIPRPETEAWASLLADLVLTSASDARVLDLCSGTGCIGLSLFARARGRARVLGLDIERRAVRLARRNLLHNFRSGYEAARKAVTFRVADIFRDEWMAALDADSAHGHGARRIDVLVSNPPYISQRGFDVDTGRSVRIHEPKIALVPVGVADSLSASCAPEDVFYARLLEIADTIRPRFAVFEVGDMAQAIRVVEMVMARFSLGMGRCTGRRDDEAERTMARWEVVEIWRDWPDCLPCGYEKDTVVVSGSEVPVRGSGHGRVVFLAERRMVRNRFTNRGFRREVYTDQ
ncbi:S-adenosyl-L-methionine-dependent methyltransferase [Xylaria nigripes]|nr:S-adenosyl-L-methionine-dependent methyltransferase [Xylaria nigripes]